MAEHELYIVTVTDRLVPALVGHAGCHYESPPQEEQQARTLIRVLLGASRTPPGGGPWQYPWRVDVATSPCTVTADEDTTCPSLPSIGHKRYGQPMSDHELIPAGVALESSSQRKSIPIEITLDRARERFETCLASAGAYALVLSSVLPKRGIELHSSYLGHPGAPTQASHLLLAPGKCGSETVEHDERWIPVMVARRRCLYDHLQRLQDFLAELGYTAQIPLADDALLAVEL